MRIQPPGIKNTSSWEDQDIWSKAMLIAYEQIREIEEQQSFESLIKILFGGV